MLKARIEHEVPAGMVLEQLAGRHLRDNGLCATAGPRPGQRGEKRHVLLMIGAHRPEHQLGSRRDRHAAIGSSLRRLALDVERDEWLSVEYREQKIRSMSRIIPG